MTKTKMINILIRRDFQGDLDKQKDLKRARVMPNDNLKENQTKYHNLWSRKKWPFNPTEKKEIRNYVLEEKEYPQGKYYLFEIGPVDKCFVGWILD